MELRFPRFSLIVLIGPAGSGKSTFARRHFKLTEVVSSDSCRGLVADDATNQAATLAAFDVLRLIVCKRLAARRLTVVDATSVKSGDRKPLLELAREYHCPPVAVVFDLPADVCSARNDRRPDRTFGAALPCRAWRTRASTPSTRLRRKRRSTRRSSASSRLLRHEFEDRGVPVGCTRLQHHRGELRLVG